MQRKDITTAVAVRCLDQQEYSLRKKIDYHSYEEKKRIYKGVGAIDDVFRLLRIFLLIFHFL